MGSDDRDSAVYAPFDAIKRHYGYLHRIKDTGEALQLAPKVIRDLGLEVVSDPVDARHAEIIGAPLRDDDEGLATYYADLLAEQARLVWKP